MIWTMKGDCLEVLKKGPDNSVDSIVTDPPAGLGFMGKAWDSDKGGRDGWVAWMTEVMTEALRVLKPGAHALVWALPRTSHWTMTALEDSGFQIRDVITHHFGSGFPKSLNVNKALEKDGAVCKCDGSERPDAEDSTVSSLRDHVHHEDAGAQACRGCGKPRIQPGMGTALKPSTEFWILCRKPLSEKTVAKNVLKWGTGALNIDGCRISTDGEDLGDPSRFNRAASQGFYTIEYVKKFVDEGGKILPCGKDGILLLHRLTDGRDEKAKIESIEKLQRMGRFPSHLVLDEEAAQALDEQSGVLKSGRLEVGHKQGGSRMFDNNSGANSISRDYGGDFGGASRFFYVAKASKSDRGAGNTHPTVKNTKLMSYLVRLITPPGGVVLDPFMGSGSTGVAAAAEGMRFIGIEQDETYFHIANGRLKKAE